MCRIVPVFYSPLFVQVGKHNMSICLTLNYREVQRPSNLVTRSQSKTEINHSLCFPASSHPLAAALLLLCSLNFNWKITDITVFKHSGFLAYNQMCPGLSLFHSVPFTGIALVRIRKDFLYSNLEVFLKTVCKVTPRALLLRCSSLERPFCFL